MSPPDCRVMRGEMVKPDRKNMLFDSWITKSLAAAIGQDHEIEPHSYRHDRACPLEVGPIDRVHGATQQHQRAGIESTLSCEHRNTAPVTVGQQVGSLNVAPGKPVPQLRSSDSSGRVAIDTRP